MGKQTSAVVGRKKNKLVQEGREGGGGGGGGGSEVPVPKKTVYLSECLHLFNPVFEILDAIDIYLPLYQPQPFSCEERFRGG